MNTSKLKSYAPKARRDFIAAVTDRAALLGITAKKVLPVEAGSDVVVIGGTPWPKSVGTQREALVKQIEADGFDRVMEAAAYSWFNRLVALRYMEMHGYLDHGYRVIGHPEDPAGEQNQLPEILGQVEHIDADQLPGLSHDQVVSLKLDSKDEELYRLVLIAQCNALHKAMPFLFEQLGDATELLLPDHLLRPGSILRDLITQVPEDQWQEIEIIGWLYQFYISEKKDEVIGKVVKSADIPAATQLFTPNWIVKYMVQNALGAQWLATYPESPLKGQMEYYIEPAEQTPEVNAQLAEITPGELDPEALTLIDPASGSGHILVEAYDLFKAIYLERGYRQRDVAQLILEKNLFGLDIDERAAQLTGFALMMKGRADDRRLFDRGVKLNVMALVDSTDFDADVLAQSIDLSSFGLTLKDCKLLKSLFEHATTFGSLIQIPEGLAEKLPALKQLSETTSQDLFVLEAIRPLGQLVQQAELLAGQYDAVVANPPYMGNKGMNTMMKKFAKDFFIDAKSDLFAMFIERAIELTMHRGRVGVVAPYVWMFLSSYEMFRSKVLDETSLSSLIQLEYNAFEPACIPVATFTLMRSHLSSFTGSYIKLSEFKGHHNQAPRAMEAINNPDCGWLYRTKPDEFKNIPGSPVAYWAPPPVFTLFTDNPPLSNGAVTAIGLFTCDNARFVRQWWEVCSSTIDISPIPNALNGGNAQKWIRYNKGGGYRRWFGANSSVVNLGDNADEIRTHRVTSGQSSALPGERYFFNEGVSWSMITSVDASFRYFPAGLAFDMSSPSLFSGAPYAHLAALNSTVTTFLLKLLNPTLNTSTGTVDQLPDLSSTVTSTDYVARLVNLVTTDWDAYERSWDFQSLPLLTVSSDPAPTLESSYTAWVTQSRETIAEMKRLEEENNRLFIDAYGLTDELTPDMPIEQITLTVNPAYRYGGNPTEEEQWDRFRNDTMQELVSYAIGCMMGRYSLDAPGLIYADARGEGFDPSRYATFPADDGVIPLTDTEWFDDDVTQRLIEFIGKAWPAESLEANLNFLAENLGPKKNESSRETIRRYLNDSFFKDHMQTYKKRPIYWLFTSGKHKAFQALVYLHRYNPGTLSRMRTKYVLPLMGKLDATIQRMDGDPNLTTKDAKELDKLKKQLVELRSFDEKLHHLADQQIDLDLDDGVKVNYGKFSTPQGEILAEVNAISGKKKKGK